MKGENFWKIFVGANVPDSELISLGEDVGYLRGTPSNNAGSALLKIGYAMKQAGVTVSSADLFTALKSGMPNVFVRQSLLNNLANSYNERRPYASLDATVRNYIETVSKRFPEITKALPEVRSEVHLHQHFAPTPTPTAAVTPAPAPVAARKAGAPVSAPPGITQAEWEYLQATIRKLQSADTAKEVTASHLAAARNLAARANLAVKDYLDIVINERGEGALDPNYSSPTAQTSFGLNGIFAIVGIFLFFFLKSR